MIEVGFGSAVGSSFNNVKSDNGQFLAGFPSVGTQILPHYLNPTLHSLPFHLVQPRVNF